jgi:hypothetical protein
MPFTFLAHQAAVLPLKWARPRWFSGTALVIGSMAPDFEYFLRGEAWSSVSHTLLGQFVFCLPLTLAGVWLVHRVIARPLGERLPGLGPLQLRGYGALSSMRLDAAFWARAALSGLVGSLSHIAWDGFTHGDGWAVLHLPALAGDVSGVPVYKVLQHGSTLVGAAVSLVFLSLIGRSRKHDAPHKSPWGVVTVVVVFACLGVVVATFEQHGAGATRLAVGAFLRGTLGAFVGLILGCLATSRARTREADDDPRHGPSLGAPLRLLP